MGKNVQNTRTYQSWYSMMQRSGPDSLQSKDYSQRGIIVCERWHDYHSFLADMGYRPAHLTLDRKDNDKGYYRDNCRWATRKEQQNNTRKTVLITYMGFAKPLQEWSRILELDPELMHGRRRRGWDAERMFETQTSARERAVTINGLTQSISQWGRDLKINRHTLEWRLRNKKAFLGPVRNQKRAAK